MTNAEKQLIVDYIIRGNNIGNTDVFEAVNMFASMNGGDIIDIIMENHDSLRHVVPGEIPQFSDEKDVYRVLRVLIDSGIDNLSNEQIGSYLCAADAKFDARRKYGETHYKFASQLGLAVPGLHLAATEIGIAYYLLESDDARQELMNRLVFSIPIVQHSILKAGEGRFYMPDYLAEYLAPSTVIRRRSNMHKIMTWAYNITTGKHRQLFDNIVWY